MPAQTQQPIIIIRKRKSHVVHHGGAWKVAYADFVTAMLSLFIVLWLLSSSEQVKKAVGGYFLDPKGSAKDVGNGLRGAGSESLAIHKDDMEKLKEKLEQAIKDPSRLQKIREHVVFTITAEGLRVELIEGENSTFFESASSVPTTFGKDLLQKLAEEIGKLPNRVTMEGHTDSRPYTGRGSYSNWELSSDRANAARRWMQENGMRADQVSQVRGYADQNPRDAAHPEDATNRRVTLIIQYLTSNSAVPEPFPPVPAKAASASAAEPGTAPAPVAGKPKSPPAPKPAPTPSGQPVSPPAVKPASVPPGQPVSPPAVAPAPSGQPTSRPAVTPAPVPSGQSGSTVPVKPAPAASGQPGSLASGKPGPLSSVSPGKAPPVSTGAAPVHGR